MKGHQVLFDACSILADRGEKIFVDVIGDGPLKDDLVESAERKGIPASFHGHLTPKAVSDVLRRATVFVQPSVTLPGHSEGAPTSVIEAMASRVPVVATNSGGVRSLIDPDETGILVNENCAEEIASAILRLSSDMAFRIRMVEAASKFVESKTWQKVGLDIRSIYESLVVNIV
jgi:glycosyltransferase involved in cell wall biosynthesis